jgi:hypothetical protein
MVDCRCDSISPTGAAVLPEQRLWQAVQIRPLHLAIRLYANELRHSTLQGGCELLSRLSPSTRQTASRLFTLLLLIRCWGDKHLLAACPDNCFCTKQQLKAATSLCRSSDHTAATYHSLLQKLRAFLPPAATLSFAGCTPHAVTAQCCCYC